MNEVFEFQEAEGIGNAFFLQKWESAGWKIGVKNKKLWWW